MEQVGVEGEEQANKIAKDFKTEHGKIGQYQNGLDGKNGECSSRFGLHLLRICINFSISDSIEFCEQPHINLGHICMRNSEGSMLAKQDSSSGRDPQP